MVGEKGETKLSCGGYGIAIIAYHLGTQAVHVR